MRSTARRILSRSRALQRVACSKLGCATIANLGIIPKSERFRSIQALQDDLKDIFLYRFIENCRLVGQENLTMLLRHTSQYMIASAIVAVLGFLSAAVFTRLLTPADYGIYIVGLSIANFVSSVVFTWVRYSVMRFEAEGDKADVRMTSLAAYIVSAMLAPIIICGLHLFSHMSWSRAVIAVFLSMGTSLFEMGQEILRSRLQVRAFIIGSVLRSALAFSVCIIIAECGGGGIGQLLGAGLAYYLAFTLCGRQIWRAPRAPIDAAKLKLFFWLGLSVTAAGIIVSFQASFDRLFIAWRFNDASAGLYGASADVVRQIILIPAGSVASAAFPLIVRTYATSSPEETRLQLERAGELLLSVLAPAAVGLALTTPYLVSFLLGSDFRPTATAVMPVLAFAWLCQSISQSYIHVSFHLSMKQSLAIPHGLAALFANAIFLWPCTSYFGFAGAAWSVLLSEFLAMVAGYLLTFRSYPLPLLIGPIRRVTIACSCMALTVLCLERWLPAYTPSAFVALAISGAAVYIVVGIVLNIGDFRSSVLQMFVASVQKDA